MANINRKIENIQSKILQLQAEENRLRHIKRLWQQLGTIPIDPETECLEQNFIPRTTDGIAMYQFPSGTHREDVWHWFEDEFNISVAKDLTHT